MLVLIAAHMSAILLRHGGAAHSPSTQYGHRICILLTLPQPEHVFNDVISLSPLPAMNRCRFLRYDVFFLGTALSMPSHISASDGREGSDSEGNASAPKGVLNGRARRCRKGELTGRMGPLSPGSSVCQSGGSGRASAMTTPVPASAAGIAMGVNCLGVGVANCRPQSRLDSPAARALPPCH